MRALARSPWVMTRGTGAYVNLLFSQFAMLPYIGDGLARGPVLFVDELTVATAKP